MTKGPQQANLALHPRKAKSYTQQPHTLQTKWQMQAAKSKMAMHGPYCRGNKYAKQCQQTPYQHIKEACMQCPSALQERAH